MSEIIRFGVSLEKDIVEKFDKHIKKNNYPNRSKAIGDLIREELIKEEWAGNKIVAGSITLVYDHHKRELTNNLTNIQHDYYDIIISTQHIHLDHDNCFEIVIVRDKPNKLHELCYKLKAEKGVKHASLCLATTGRGL